MTGEIHDSMKQWVIKRQEMNTADKLHVFVCMASHLQPDAIT